MDKIILKGKLFKKEIGQGQAEIEVSPQELIQQLWDMTLYGYPFSTLIQFINFAHQRGFEPILPQPQQEHSKQDKNGNPIWEKPQQEGRCVKCGSIVQKEGCPVCGGKQYTPIKPQQEFCECKEPNLAFVSNETVCHRCCKPIHPEPKPELASECPKCDGSGETDDGGSEFRDREYSKCPECNGTGILLPSNKEKDYWDDYKDWLKRLKEGDKSKDELTPEESYIKHEKEMIVHALVGKVGKIEPKKEIKDEKEPIEIRLARIERLILELLNKLPIIIQKELTQDDWLKIMNKPPIC